jgi:hypothetical protein
LPFIRREVTDLIKLIGSCAVAVDHPVREEGRYAIRVRRSPAPQVDLYGSVAGMSYGMKDDIRPGRRVRDEL